MCSSDLKPPKAVTLAHSTASGIEVEMRVLENEAIRGCKKQLHKLEDFLGAVLSKDESERKWHWRKKFTCCFWLPDFFFKFYLFLAALVLHCCARDLSSCGERGLLFVAVRGLLIAVASLVAEHGL